MIKIRAKKAATESPSEPAAASSANLQMQEILPGLGVAACGLLAALLLIWFGIININQQRQLEQMVQAWGSTQADVLQHAITQLSKDTQRAARNPQ